MSEQTEAVVTVEEIDTAELPTLHRHANRMLFVAWANADMPRRGWLDVLDAVMLYDAEKYFVAAAGALPNADELRALHAGTTIRYWSKGI